MGDLDIGVIVKATLVMIVLLVIVTLFATVMNPILFAQQVLPELTAIPLQVVYDNIPCMINCFTNLQGAEITMLSQAGFLDIDAVSLLVNWFPCNNKIMTMAMLVNELAKWDYDIDNTKMVRSPLTGTSFYGEAKRLMHTCITAPTTEGECYNPAMTFSKFCVKDDYLTNYNFLPCYSSNTFVDFLDRHHFSYFDRRGRDIDNDFVCDSSIGEAYNPDYSLCNPDTPSKYDQDDCKPSWLLLEEQEGGGSGEERGYAKGRCEDFALLYYSLFRSIDVSADDMSFELGACELPCPCKELMRRLDDCDSEYEQDSCYVDATLKFAPAVGLSDISGCEGIENKPLPEEKNGGRFTMRVIDDESTYFWYVQQNFTEGNTSGATRLLSLDFDYTDDTWSASNTFFGKQYDYCTKAVTNCVVVSNHVETNTCDVVSEGACVESGTSNPCSEGGANCVTSTAGSTCSTVSGMCVKVLDNKPVSCVEGSDNCVYFIDGVQDTSGISLGSACTLVSGADCFKITGGKPVACVEGDADCKTLSDITCGFVREFDCNNPDGGYCTPNDTGCTTSVGDDCTVTGGVLDSVCTLTGEGSLCSTVGGPICKLDSGAACGTVSSACAKNNGGLPASCGTGEVCTKVVSNKPSSCGLGDDCNIVTNSQSISCSTNSKNCKKFNEDWGFYPTEIVSYTSGNLYSSTAAWSGTKNLGTYTIDYAGALNTKPTDVGLPFRLGLKIKINSLSDCIDGSVVVGIGLGGDEMDYYLMKEKEDRGIEYKGVFDDNAPVISFIDDNPDCTINYAISAGTTGFIITDPCRNYYDSVDSLLLDPAEEFDYLINACEPYISEGFNVTGGDFSDTKPSSLSDLKEICTLNDL